MRRFITTLKKIEESKLWLFLLSISIITIISIVETENDRFSLIYYGKMSFSIFGIVIMGITLGEIISRYFDRIKR